MRAATLYVMATTASLVFLSSVQAQNVTAGFNNTLAWYNGTYEFKCPLDPLEPFRFPVFEDTQVTLEKTPLGEIGLCTLELNHDGLSIPVSRSYDGHDWERAGGGVAAGLKDWACDDLVCSLVLPPANYTLTSKGVADSTRDAEIARFLESTSFGVTQDDLKSWMYDSFTGYIQDQMKLPATSHRAFFRKRTNPIWSFHHPEFASTMSPCAPGSTWRPRALSLLDYRKPVAIRRVGDRWEIKIDDQVRTMVKELRFRNEHPHWEEVIESGTEYKLCSNYHDMRRGVYRLRWGQKKKAKCRALISEDLIIDFPPSYKPKRMLSHPLPSLSSDEWSVMPDYLTEYRISLENSMCQGLPTFDPFGPPTYAKTRDGEWLLHDPRIIMEENTMENPLPDGGYGDWKDDDTFYCSNVPRSIFNEDTCFLSTTKACVAGSDNKATAQVGALVCGSPGEVANDPDMGDNWYGITSVDVRRGKLLDLPGDDAPAYFLAKQREQVWSDIALTSADQLRQRMAWALYQIFALPKVAIGNEHRNTEIFLKYYDIFVRNAFTNYRDLIVVGGYLQSAHGREFVVRVEPFDGFFVSAQETSRLSRRELRSRVDAVVYYWTR